MKVDIISDCPENGEFLFCWLLSHSAPHIFLHILAESIIITFLPGPPDVSCSQSHRACHTHTWPEIEQDMASTNLELKLKKVCIRVPLHLMIDVQIYTVL